MTNSTAALMTALAGLLCLAVWRKATIWHNINADRLIGKSIWLFILPVAGFIVFIEYSKLVVLFVLLAVAVEEAIKLFASRTENQQLTAFWLVMLFGIWELMLAKPYQVLNHDLTDWARYQWYGQIFLMFVPVLLHSVTAIIYAFYGRSRPWLQFGVCYTLHLAFNTGFIFFDVFGIGFVFSVLAAAGLAALAMLLWSGTHSTSLVQPDMSQRTKP